MPSNPSIYDFGEIQKHVDRIRQEEQKGRVSGTEQGVDITPKTEQERVEPGYYGLPTASPGSLIGELRPTVDPVIVVLLEKYTKISRPWTSPHCWDTRKD